MPIHNAEIARIFNHVADLLEISDANPFRVRAYRNAARTVEDQPQSLTTMLNEDKDLTELPGIGDDLAAKIAEIVSTGSLKMLEDLEQTFPEELSDLLQISGLGPKRVATLHQKLGIDNLDQLAEAVNAQKIRALRGFGEKTEKHIIKELERHAGAKPRTKLNEAEQVIDPLQAYLEGVEGVKRVVIAGSYRRRKETVGDLDVLVTCKSGSPVMSRFTEFEDVVEVMSSGKTKSSVRLRGGLQVDLRVVPEVSYGAALYYFTGSKEHNIAVRKIAVEKGLKINEYGVFRGKGDDEERIAGASEEDIFRTVGLSYIEPELRENHGEIEAAQQSNLPQLIVRDDLRGDLHAHTKATDGHASLQEMAEAARSLGYSYLAITEHSQAVSVAKGFDSKRLLRQTEEIDQLSDQYPGFRIL
ncbi:MAG: helix-hairpin-helix domain-containing protein, partial [Desulfuromonadales bacterium]|nr:helix-hairpin-helix domain-containing protein [Desulfuromonadales bacterium]